MSTPQIIAIVLTVLSSIAIGYFFRKTQEKIICNDCEVKMRSKALWFRINGEWNHLILNADFGVMLNGEEADSVGNIIGLDRLLNKEDKIELYNCTKGIEMLSNDLQKDLKFEFKDFAELN